jgi:enediyne biosynthesis protein E4
VESFAHPNIKRIAAIAICASLFAVAWMHRPTPASASRSPGVNGRFSFTNYSLPTLPGQQQKVRHVNPSLDNISGWISAVGAAVALNDIDGDGLPNDICYVDPRIDQVIVEPAPGTGARYHAFALDASPLKLDRQITAPMGCLPGDFDEDGKIDLLVYYWGRTPIIFLNRLDAKHQDELDSGSFQPVELVPQGGRWFTNAALLADLDGDGHTDILLGNYFPDGAEILDSKSAHAEHMQESMSHAFNGGRKHFFLWRPPLETPVNFQEVVPALVAGDDQPVGPKTSEEILNGWTLAAAAADLNGDLLPELYIANDFGPDRLLENMSRPGLLKFRLLLGRRSFFTPKSKVLGRDSFKSMGVAVADINGDGRLDILVSNIADEYALEESNFAFLSTSSSLADDHGFAQFQDRSEELGISRSGWSWDIKTGDFDNDGKPEIVVATGFLNSASSQPEVGRWPELHEIAMGNDVLLQYPKEWHRFKGSDALSNHNRTPFYVVDESGRYEDISQEIGLRHPFPGRGIAVADVDGNGLLDFAIANQWGTSEFYRNASKVAASSLTLKLLMPTNPANGLFHVADTHTRQVQGSPAIGACASVRLPDGKLLVEQVDGGNGHSGKNSFEVHFGLGAQQRTLEYPVKLNWRGRDGQPHSRNLTLTAGRYSIVLGEH